MNTIHKYQFDVTDEFSVRMPRGADVLSVQVQYGTPCVWAAVDTNAEKVTRKFSCRGTGHDISGLTDAMFVGTFQLHGGDLVFHLFDRGER